MTGFYNLELQSDAMNGMNHADAEHNRRDCRYDNYLDISKRKL